jgi:hypothetical protein
MSRARSVSNVDKGRRKQPEKYSSAENLQSKDAFPREGKQRVSVHREKPPSAGCDKRRHQVAMTLSTCFAYPGNCRSHSPAFV